MGSRRKMPHRSPFEGKIAVFGMMERGGRVRQLSRTRTTTVNFPIQLIDVPQKQKRSNIQTRSSFSDCVVITDLILVTDWNRKYGFVLVAVYR